MKVIFIRHGKTKGNTEGRYIGTTDEPLAKIGISELKSIKYPYAARIISSPLKRCIQSAQLIYNTNNIEVFKDLRECDFGEFENKNYEELRDNAYYKRWLESGGKIPFPKGEGHKEFCLRCCECFESIVKSNKSNTVAFVVHGGTIMAVLEKYEGISFYDRQIKNGGYLCFECVVENGSIRLYESR